MTPSQLRLEVVTERARWVREMIGGIQALPLATLVDFLADPRTPAAAESYLRRALEALLDLGRHLLAKGFGKAPAEYKEVARLLGESGVLDAPCAALLVRLAGYRNRMVHFYAEVSQAELYELCTERRQDLELLLEELLAWLRAHPERLDRSL